MPYRAWRLYRKKSLQLPGNLVTAEILGIDKVESSYFLHASVTYDYP